MAATSLAPTLNTTTITEQLPFPERRILVIAKNRASAEKLYSGSSLRMDTRSRLVADDLVGLEILRKRPPSALTLDLRYPASVGWELCREIAQSAPDIPFVILRANSDVVDKNRRCLTLETIQTKVFRE